MQLTRAADYAVRVMLHLASQPDGTVISKSVLAKASDAPPSFLSKILQAMARAGLIQGRRGVEGGFLLTEGGAQASLLDVVESIDGPVALNLCLSSGDCCDRSGHCAAHGVWQRAQSAMVAVLRESKIAEMAGAGPYSGSSLHVETEQACGKPEAEAQPRWSVVAKPKRTAKSKPADTKRQVSEAKRPKVAKSKVRPRSVPSRTARVSVRKTN
jgi:Rrf2 family protein